MSWLLLLAAGLMEIVMAAALKSAHGWSRPLPALVGVVAALASIYLLTHALRDLPVGTAYAVWTGIGAIGVAAIGILFHGDTPSPARLGCVALILAGIVGLRLLGAGETP